MERPLLSKYGIFFGGKNESEIQLLEQRYVDLRTTFEKVKLSGEHAKPHESLIEKVEKFFEIEKSWDNANHIEQFLVSLYSPAELEVEMKVKLIHAKRRLREESWELYNYEFSNSNTEEKQSLLSRLNKELHWAYDVEELGKDYVTKTRIRTGLLFILSIFMFFMVDQVPLIANLLDITPGDRGDSIVTAMAAGWMGTSFSMLISLKNRIQISSISDLKVIHRFDYLFTRALIGMVSGLLLFYAFDADILTGIFFPEFGTDSANSINNVSEKNFSLLVVWCFISGFSEKLVPDLLSKTEQSIKQE